MFKSIAIGFMVKFMGGFDDTVTKIPVTTYFTNTRLGRFFFVLGNLISLLLTMVCAYFLAHIINDIKYVNEITGIMIILLSFSVYLDFFPKKTETKIAAKVTQKNKINTEKILSLIFWGFVVNLITLIDDIIIFAPLYINGIYDSIGASLGILLATAIQFYAMIYFSEQLTNFEYTKHLAAGSLLILGILVMLNLI